MRYLLILLLFISGAASAQFAPTSTKTAFKWGVSIGTRDSSAYAANDSLVVTINRQGRMMYRSTDGYWKLLANAASSDYVSYVGAITNVNLGNFRLTARSLKTDSIYSNSSAGGILSATGGSSVMSWGAGGSVEVDFHGFAGYDANRSASYTARSFTDKNYVDSSVALRLRISDTAAMLAPFVQYSDTTGLFSNAVRTFGTQTIGGNKTFTNDAVINDISIGRGAGSLSSNTRVGNQAFVANTTGFGNTAIGQISLWSNTTGFRNTALGLAALYTNTTGGENTAVGVAALQLLTVGTGNVAVGYSSLNNVTSGNYNVGAGISTLNAVTTGQYNTALGHGAGSTLTTGSNNVYVGYNTSASGTAVTNEIVLGTNLTGNGSNTVTIGNSSVTGNYFNGFLKQTSVTSALVKASSTGVLQAAVAGTDYAPAVAGGYLPLSGGTLTGALAGINGTFSGTFQSSKLVSSGDAASNLGELNLINTGAGGKQWRIGDGIAVANGTLAIFNSTNSALAMSLNGSSEATFYGALRGTSLSMSGATQLATSSGRVLIKTTTDNGTDALQVAGSGLFSSSVTATGAIVTTGSNAGFTINRRDNSGYAGGWYSPSGSILLDMIGVGSAVSFTGGTGAATFISSVQATGFFESSDLRLKDVIKRDGDIAYFKWKDGSDNKTHIGYIAQEVQKKNPDQVKADDKGFLSVNYTEVLVEKVRALEKKIEELEKLVKK